MSVAAEAHERYIAQIWNQLPLSRQIDPNQLEAELSDGVLVAEFVRKFQPFWIDMDDFTNEPCTIDQKYIRWLSLNRIVFKKLGFDIADSRLRGCARGDPGVVQKVVGELQTKLQSYLAAEMKRHDDENRGVSSAGGAGVGGAGAAEFSSPPRAGAGAGAGAGAMSQSFATASTVRRSPSAGAGMPAVAIGTSYRGSPSDYARQVSQDIEEQIEQFNRDLLSQHATALESFQDQMWQLRNRALGEEKEICKRQLATARSDAERQRMDLAHRQKLEELDKMMEDQFQTQKEHLRQRMAKSRLEKLEAFRKQLLDERGPRGGGGGDGWETDEEEEALDPAASRQLTASQVRGKRLMRDAVQVCKETADVLESKADNLRGLYADMSDVVSDSKRITSASKQRKLLRSGSAGGRLRSGARSRSRSPSSASPSPTRSRRRTSQGYNELLHDPRSSRFDPARFAALSAGTRRSSSSSAKGSRAASAQRPRTLVGASRLAGSSLPMVSRKEVEERRRLAASVSESRLGTSESLSRLNQSVLHNSLMRSEGAMGAGGIPASAAIRRPGSGSKKGSGQKGKGGRMQLGSNELEMDQAYRPVSEAILRGRGMSTGSGAGSAGGSRAHSAKGSRAGSRRSSISRTSLFGLYSSPSRSRSVSRRAWNDDTKTAAPPKRKASIFNKPSVNRRSGRGPGGAGGRPVSAAVSSSAARRKAFGESLRR